MPATDRRRQTPRPASRARGRAAAVVLAVLAALALRPGPAAAEPPEFIKIAAPVTAREAFADEYGQLMVDEMFKALLKGAQPACLSERGLARADQLRDRGEALLVRFGQGIGDKMLALVNAEAADQEFMRLAGPYAINELRVLMKDPAVVELQRISRVADRDRLVDRTTETFDRYVLLHRIKIDRISPLVTGSTFLMEKNRAIDADEKSDAFIARASSPEIKRYLELVEAAGQALEAGLDRGQLARLGPTQLMEGLDAALVALCVGE
jgi:hypothetical protein